MPHFCIINYNATVPNQLVSGLSCQKKLNLKLGGKGEGAGRAGHGLYIPECQYGILP